jgi:uncharacterized coiled-coil protein SlyX
VVTRGDVGMLLGLCGFLLGGIGAYLGFRAEARVAELDNASAHDGEMIETLAEKVTGLREDLKAANVRISALLSELEQRRKDDVNLRARLGQIEERLPR